MSRISSPLALWMLVGCTAGEIPDGRPGDETAVDDSEAPGDSAEPSDSGDSGEPADADADADGWPASMDCDDADPEVGAGASSFDGSRLGYWHTQLDGETGRTVVADLDADGVPDLAVPGETGLTLLHGVGDGTFSEAGVLTTPNLLAAAAGDLDGDGVQDLAAIDEDGQLYAFAGAGEGSFSATPTLVSATGCADPTALQAGDLDGDGREDLATLCEDPRLILSLSQPDGSWSNATTTPDHGADHLAIGDLDGDGDLDLVLGGDRARSITALENDGLAGMSEHTLSLMEGNWTLALADVNADGVRDVVAGHDDDLTLVWFEHDGAWGFERRVASRSTGLNMTTYELAVGDLDGDGVEELAQLAGSYVFTWTAESLGPTYVDETLWHGEPLLPTAADLNGDGLGDLVISDGDGEIIARLGLGDGSFQSPASVEMRSIVTLRDADVDGDGLDDLVAVDEDGLVTLFHSTGTALVASGSFLTDGRMRADLALLDLDGDGDQDIVATSYMDQLRVGEVEGGSIVDDWIVDLDDLRATSLFVVDWEGEGTDLLAAAKAGGDELLLPIFGDGAGGLSPSESIDVDENDSHLGLADLTGDGELDLIRGGPPSVVIELWRGVGDGDFETIATLSIGDYLAEILTGDIDGDGVSEVLFSTEDERSVSQVIWDGSVLRTETVVAPSIEHGSDPWQLEDLNGDGALDLVVSSGTSGPGLLIGDGAGGFTFTGELNAQLPFGVSEAVALDLDGDGDQDLALVDENEGIQVFLNTCESP